MFVIVFNMQIAIISKTTFEKCKVDLLIEN